MAQFRRQYDTDAFGRPVARGSGVERVERLEREKDLVGLVTAHPWRSAFALYVPVSVALTVGWGVWGWAISAFALAVAFLFAALRAYVAFRSSRDGRNPSQDESVLTVLPVPVNSLEAELLCQALEREGIPATYFGRANPGGSIPGGGVGFGWRRRYAVGVRAGDVERALALAREFDATSPSNDA